MDKEYFMIVLQCSLLAFDGLGVQELCSQYGFPEKLAIAGCNLTKYLKSIQFKECAK
jgi:hypothetical protein